MGVVHPSGRAARRLPLPDIGIAGFRVMQSAAAHGGRRAGHRLRSGMKGSAAGQRDIGGGQQHRKLVFVVLMLVAELKAGMKQVPSVGFLDERQVLQRTRRILPGEEEIRIGAVVHRADLDSGFALAVEISAFAGQQRKRLDVTPCPIGRVAVEDRCVGGVDAADLHAIHRQPIGSYDERGAGDRGGGRDHERIGLQRRVSRSRGAARRAGRRIRLTRSIASHLCTRLQRVGRGIGRRVRVFGFRQACRLLGQHAQQFDGIEPRRRRRQRGGTKDAQQLRNAAALELGQDMQDDKGEDHPGPDPVQHRHVIAGVETEIEQAAADQQPRHRDKENPVHQGDHGAQPRLPAAEQSAQPNLVELDAATEAGAEHIDDVADRHRDQDDRGLHMGESIRRHAAARHRTS